MCDIYTVEEDCAGVTQVVTEGRTAAASLQAPDPTCLHYKERLGSSLQSASGGQPVLAHLAAHGSAGSLLGHIGSHMLHGALHRSFTCSLPRQ